MSEIDDIKGRLDIVDIVSEAVQLRRAGRRYTGFCPFHPNSKTPAFYVFPETQTWHCFGACAEGGDVFTFVMKKQGLDFRAALEQLAARAGVTLEKRKQSRPDKVKNERQASLLELAADYFHHLLLHAPQAEGARAYLAGRAFDEPVLEAFKLGFALNSWDACRTHFAALGYNSADLLAAGLLTENEEKGTTYDRFRNRLMIPIKDLNGDVVGFGARTLEKDGVPKYLNSPQTASFDKSRLLYGIDHAKRAIREARHVVIVEGYMDVIRAWQGGFHNVVAQMGTALTATQLQLLKRYSKRFVIALDADAAGAQATLRSLEVARETLDREIEFAFDARGLVKQEGRLKADIRVAKLPDGQDPDDIIRADSAHWEMLIDQAQPIVAYVIGVLAADLDMNDAKAKSAVAQQIAPLILDIADAVERDHYWQMLARTLETDERALRQIKLPRKRAKAKTPQKSAERRRIKVPTGQRRIAPLETNRLEANLLAECLREPMLVSQVNALLSNHKQPLLTRDDFSNAEDHAIWLDLRQIIENGAVVGSDELCDSLDTLLQPRARTLLAELDTSHLANDRNADTLARRVLDCRLDKIKRLRSEVRNLVQEAQQQDDAEAKQAHLMHLNMLTLLIRSINQAQHAMSASSTRQSE